MGCLNDRSRIATFFEKLAHFFKFVRKIRVITAQTSESKKLRIGNGILDMGGKMNATNNCENLWVCSAH